MYLFMSIFVSNLCVYYFPLKEKKGNSVIIWLTKKKKRLSSPEQKIQYYKECLTCCCLQLKSAGFNTTSRHLFTIFSFVFHRKSFFFFFYFAIKIIIFRETRTTSLPDGFNFDGISSKALHWSTVTQDPAVSPDLCLAFSSLTLCFSKF